jgi:hypothetical protein
MLMSTADDSPVNQRRQPRSPFPWDVFVRCGEDAFTCEMVDLSVAGLRLAGADIAIDDEVKVYLELPQPGGSKKFILLQGRVRWARDHQAGIEFTETLDEDTFAAIYAATTIAA